MYKYLAGQVFFGQFFFCKAKINAYIIKHKKCQAKIKKVLKMFECETICLHYLH